MEDKIIITQDSKETTIKTTDEIKELRMTFSQYRVDTLHVIFKD